MNAILYNARIHPQYRVGKRPTAVVFTGGKITELGHDEKALFGKYPRHRRFDLDGRVVLPGFVDSHVHFYFWAATLDTVHLDHTESFDDALDTIRSFVTDGTAGEWIIGDGWSADRWNPYHLPTAAELDAVTGRHPAALFSKDQHILWANSKAMELAGIGKNTPDPKGGKIDRDADGNPTGILREIPGYFPVVRLINDPDPVRMDRLWRRAQQIAYSRGVTGFHSMDGHEGWQFFRKHHEDGKLGFRIQYFFPVAMLDTVIADRMTSGMGDDTLRVGGIKIFADGSLGAQTAYMKKPYRGRKNDCGVAVTDLNQLTFQIGKAIRNNLACAVHAIGDRAVANVIAAFSAAGYRSHLRNRIEHLQLISREDIPRLKKSKVVASMQPSHCPSDRQLVAAYWGERGRNAYIFRTLLNEGVPLTFGSDCPIEPLDPLGGIHAAVNRNGFGERGGRFYPEERLTVAQAVHGFTDGPAYASGRESFSGRIAPGYQADLVILDDDIYTMPKADIYKARVAATIFDGKAVYGGGSIDFHK